MNTVMLISYNQSQGSNMYFIWALIYFTFAGLKKKSRILTKKYLKSNNKKKLNALIKIIK